MICSNKFFLIVTFCILPCLALLAQDTITIKEITVSAYLQDRPFLNIPSSVSLIDSAQISQHLNESFVPIINSTAGVRMEERSPGSYRLSLRGSLLRSPFGIRNIKIYMNEFPLTDAGGNTYLNLLDVTGIQHIEVLKGPDGSLFGANSGGIIRLEVFPSDISTTKGSVGLTGGSFDLFHQHASVQIHQNNHTISLNQAWIQSDGYRNHSQLDRKHFMLTDSWRYSANSKIKILLFYTDLGYETPGGLTKDQYEANPKASRPATKTLPGAREQKAGVFNNTIYSGLSHETQLGESLKHVMAVFGSSTNFENPFITNYEIRDEKNLGLRSWIETGNKKENPVNWNLHLGYEGQLNNMNISNFQNDKGLKGTLIIADKLKAFQQFAFAKLTNNINSKWIIETGLSINFNSFKYAHAYPFKEATTNHKFENIWMPRLALSRQFGKYIAVRSIVSKGYSPATLAEFRSSDNLINTNLQAEHGWNYETGLRLHDSRGIIWWDISAFYYSLQQAIVRRMNEDGEEFFINAGGTKQAGLESQLTFVFVSKPVGLFRTVQYKNCYTYNDFTFSNYIAGINNYSGNKITGVPDHIVVNGLFIKLRKEIFLHAQHTFTSSIPLNDAGTDLAHAYHLIQLKTGLKILNRTRMSLILFAGIDNLLNETYSLGHDLNAAGGRFYNAAPVRNFFVGIKATFN